MSGSRDQQLVGVILLRNQRRSLDPCCLVTPIDPVPQRCDCSGVRIAVIKRNFHVCTRHNTIGVFPSRPPGDHYRIKVSVCLLIDAV